jgi:hypothetical protein
MLNAQAHIICSPCMQHRWTQPCIHLTREACQCWACASVPCNAWQCMLWVSLNRKHFVTLST